MIQAYNYMLEGLPVRREMRYPVSRRSELKKVYDDIVSLSKRLPFYKINLSRENQEYTIGVKETALALKARIKDMADTEVSGFKSKKATVSDERILSARLLSEDTAGLPEDIRLQVKSLAAVQINKGRELLRTSRSLSSGTYEFQAKIAEETYHLEYNQEERTENRETLQNMADFLNRSVPGINALVEAGPAKDYERLTIIADMSGRFGDKKITFDDSGAYNEGIVDFFGMNRMEQAPAYARFELNGTDRQTATNTFTLENTLRITLQDSGEQPVTLRLVPDSERILKAVDSVLNTYNDLVRLAKDRTSDSMEHYRAAKLIGELKSLEKAYQEELFACGIRASEDGSLSLEDSLAVQAAEDGGMESLFTRENGFIARLYDKADTIAINPMEYLDKTVVTYPDNEKNSFRNPYVTSMYSGLFFNSYC